MSSKVSISHGTFATKQRLAANSHFGDKDEQIESKDLEPSNYAIQLFAKSKMPVIPRFPSLFAQENIVDISDFPRILRL